MKAWVRPFAAIALFATAACTAPAPASPGPSASSSPTTTPGPRVTASPVEQVYVAFIRDLSVPDADEHALPALQGTQLAFQTAALVDPDAAPLELALVDVGEGSSSIDAIVGDPSFVAAIVAPGVEVDVPEEIPVLSLSSLATASETGVRLVPPIATAARALARGIRNAPCILSEDPPPDRFGALVARRSGEPSTPVAAAGAAALVTERGCRTVVWAGGPDAGGDVAVALDGAGIRLVGGDRLLDHDFLAEAGHSAEGSRAFCPCADVSTSTAFAARRFIQDYQSEFGSAPAAYSVEGWDAGRLLLRAVREVEATREAVGGWLGGVAAHEGLAGIYRFGEDGELLDPEGAVRVYRVVGGRWVSAASP